MYLNKVIDNDTKEVIYEERYDNMVNQRVRTETLRSKYTNCTIENYYGDTCVRVWKTFY